MKGKTYDEIYGVEKANKLKKTRSNFLKENNPSLKVKGKTYDEIYGVEKAKKLKEKRRIGRLGIKTGEYKICPNCKKNFYVYPYARKIRLYCSMACKKVHYIPLTKGQHKNLSFVKCKHCKKEFKDYNKISKKYCSNECYIKHQKIEPIKVNKIKLEKTRNITKDATKKLIKEIKNKGNRVINFDKKPRPDLIEIDFKNNKIIAHEIQTSKSQYGYNKINNYKKQFKDIGLVYDLVEVIRVDKTKKVWQKFPAKNLLLVNNKGEYIK